MVNKIILLTACVNPKKMIYTKLNNAEVRRQQYIKSLTWYLKNTEYKIVFVENTDTDFSNLFFEYIQNGRLEYITFDGNNFNKFLGKGYGECKIIKYALDNSKIFKDVRKNGYLTLIAKITGRLIIKNIKNILDHCNENFVYANRSYAKTKTMLCDSMLFVSSYEYLEKKLVPGQNLINDAKGYFFEHLLFDTSLGFQKDFFYSIYIEGYSGTTGGKYIRKRYSPLLGPLNFIMHKMHIYRMYDENLSILKQLRIVPSRLIFTPNKI